ncbi:hypothetical protein [Sphingomonas bacterium]|uniref:hypothetical protein n=1 Tax=Sphingomonas bacterium TaxID=1895847 RepID=UPI001576CA94|nr:hypothetical protein [Sphingomonas bacterium]
MAKKAPALVPLDLGPAQAGGLIAALVLGVLVGLVALMALPVDRYYQWQQVDGTILFRARWIYERIHFDPTPIDAAVIGSSRMEASVRTPELSRMLSQRLGRPIHVVNFALPQEGRDLHWAVADELLANRPELRLLLLSASPEAVLSHPGFRFLGDDRSVAGSPALYNPSYVDNLLTLPYRHLSYFVQGLWPRAFQLSPRFDPAIYRARGFDPTDSFVSATGNFVDRNRQLDPATVDAQRAARAAEMRVDPKLRFLPLDRRYAVERHFDRKIARAARDRGVMLGFLRVPVFDAEEHFADPAFYRAIGPVWEASLLGSDPADYMDMAHLNRHGTARLLPWLADRLAPLLAAPEKPHVR